jgi:glycosyltransferase involved in cell wall biosynthesis
MIPGLSLVICTYNRSALLRELLESIERELTERLELDVVVVDNNSNDDTRAVVADFEGRLPGLRYILELNQGLSVARNRGAAEANKEYLLYLDDDATLSEGFLERAEIVLRRFKPDFFGGPMLPRFDRPVPEWFDPSWEIRQNERFSGFSENCSVTGANFGVRRSVLERLGPFDITLGMSGETMAYGEDREMVERYRALTPKAEQRLYYAVELFIYHYTMPYKLDAKYQLRRKYDISRTKEVTFLRHGKRSFATSLVRAVGHVGLFPLTAALAVWRHGWGPKTRFQLVWQMYGIAGDWHGLIDIVRLSLRGQTSSEPSSSAVAS